MTVSYITRPVCDLCGQTVGPFRRYVRRGRQGDLVELLCADCGHGLDPLDDEVIGRP